MLPSAARTVVCLSLCLCVCQVRGSHIPSKMNRTLQNLLQYYKIPPKDRFSGKPVFAREPLYSRMEIKHLFMSSVLETYEKLIGQMLKQLPTPTPLTATATPGSPSKGVEVRAELNYLLHKIQDLRKHRYQEQSELVQRLQSLGRIQMDNFVVQSKALWELPWLYEQASSLSNEVKMQRRRRRRRRQAQRVKAPPRV
ncbi:interferon gamma [Solea senegalensis]|uniref:Interferon gamma n=1 Tax=Solea senegalensis TaxID=28829 RepID=A0AAV6QS47_SOLSE|nr:interferon gamma 1 isoform X2 [Solea senegalensis]KAG7495875.1 interferon gamma [Solea senegalensis]